MDRDYEPSFSTPLGDALFYKAKEIGRNRIESGKKFTFFTFMLPWFDNN